MSSCQHVKTDGQPCRAQAVAGSTLCFFHDPEKVSERDAARRAGGRGRQPADPVSRPPVSLKTCADVRALLAETINRVRRGELEPKTANTIGYLSSVLIKAVELQEIENDLDMIERAVMPRIYPGRTGGDDVDMKHLVEEGFSCRAI